MTSTLSRRSTSSSIIASSPCSASALASSAASSATPWPLPTTAAPSPSSASTTSPSRTPPAPSRCSALPSSSSTVLKKLAQESSKLARYNKKPTISSVCLILPSLRDLHSPPGDQDLIASRSLTLASLAVCLLVSTNEPYLLALALVEKLDDLNRVAAVASRLGRRCSHPALLGFEHVYSDLLAGRINPAGLGSLSKDMDGTVRKMEGFFTTSGIAIFASPTSPSRRVGRRLPPRRRPPKPCRRRIPS